MIIATTKERLLKYLDNKDITTSVFLRETGIKRGFLDSDKLKSTVSDIFTAKIIAVYTDLNIYWLLTGKGEMLKEISGYIQNKVEEPPYEFKTSEKISLVYGKTIGGFGGDKFSIDRSDVKDFYVIPKFKNKHIDFMIEVEGSSMYPKYNSGDIVACRIINESKFIQWNKTHVIATNDQGILIKRIKPSTQSGTVTIISDNKDYDPFDVSLEDVSGLALVVGVIRLE